MLTKPFVLRVYDLELATLLKQLARARKEHVGIVGTEALRIGVNLVIQGETPHVHRKMQKLAGELLQATKPASLRHELKKREVIPVQTVSVPNVVESVVAPVTASISPLVEAIKRKVKEATGADLTRAADLPPSVPDRNEFGF